MRKINPRPAPIPMIPSQNVLPSLEGAGGSGVEEISFRETVSTSKIFSSSKLALGFTMRPMR